MHKAARVICTALFTKCITINENNYMLGNNMVICQEGNVENVEIEMYNSLELKYVLGL